MADITIYTKTGCPYCVRALQLLDQLGAEYREVVLDDRVERAKVQERYDWPTVPMIVVGGEFLGGSDDLQRLHARGRLAPMLAGADAST